MRTREVAERSFVSGVRTRTKLSLVKKTAEAAETAEGTLSDGNMGFFFLPFPRRPRRSNDPVSASERSG